MTTPLEYRISPNGRHAVCLASGHEVGLHLETWTWSASAGWQPGHRLGPARHPQMLPTDDGRVLAYDGLGDACISLYDQTGNPQRLTKPGACSDLRLFSAPGPARPGLAIVYRDGHCEIWRLQDRRPALTRRLARVPGVLMSGLRLDPAGDLLAMERAEVAGGPTEVVAVDLRDGSWSTLLDTGRDSHDCVLVADPHTGLLVVGTDATGARQVGWARLGQPGPVRFPTGLNPGGEGVQPLALSPDGQHVLLHRTVGVRSRLSVYTPTADHVTDLVLPPASVHGQARWTAEALSFAYSTPTQPARLTAVPSLRATGSATHITLPPDPTAPAAPVRIELLEGAGGPVETIVYGERSWRDSDRLLLALHGGPLSAWRYEFHPLLNQLANAGVAIVAPNQRGSTGYGVAHTLAIQGAWGGPDLDDVLHIAAGIQRYRRDRGLGRLRLLGDSYGAYLALLAASCVPGLWSQCAALAPFLSGQRLYAQAGLGVRGLLDRLGGRTEIDDERGPRDVLRLCERIEADLFIAHGVRDAMAPVSQSRALRQRLVAAGRREGHDLHYLEMPEGTHELTTDPDGPVPRAVIAFLASPPSFAWQPAGFRRSGAGILRTPQTTSVERR
jgi:hypothetical protein